MGNRLPYGKIDRSCGGREIGTGRGSTREERRIIDRNRLGRRAVKRQHKSHRFCAGSGLGNDGRINSEGVTGSRRTVGYGSQRLRSRTVRGRILDGVGGTRSRGINQIAHRDAGGDGIRQGQRHLVGIRTGTDRGPGHRGAVRAQRHRIVARFGRAGQSFGVSHHNLCTIRGHRRRTHRRRGVRGLGQGRIYPRHDGRHVGNESCRGGTQGSTGVTHRRHGTATGSGGGSAVIAANFRRRIQLSGKQDRVGGAVGDSINVDTQRVGLHRHHERADGLAAGVEFADPISLAYGIRSAAEQILVNLLDALVCGHPGVKRRVFGAGGETGLHGRGVAVHPIGETDRIGRTAKISEIGFLYINIGNGHD